MKNKPLYNAILERHSVRQYIQEELDPKLLTQISGVISKIHPLCDDNNVQFKFMNNLNTTDRIAASGPYGRFVVSPHIVLPYTTAALAPLVEIGFQAEQFCVLLYEMGLGSCYLGTAGRERGLIQHFGLAANSEMGAAIVYGRARVDETRSLANYFRKPGYRTRRKTWQDIFYIRNYGNAGNPPAELETVMLAAQRAPSATNAQPWRFVLADAWLYLYVNPAVYPFVLNEKNRLTYALHDAGIVMANISMAYEAQDSFRNWTLYDPDQPPFPVAPAEAVPVAKIRVLE